MSATSRRIAQLPTCYLTFLVILLFFPAHLIHLGLAPFIGDEAIRALVALEMDLSGNYIAPTMHGAPYINKPPLYNWILLLFFKLFGWFGEYPARTATVFFLCLFTWTVYRFTRREFGFEFAFLSAFMVATSGRFLLYDSMLGLIDTAFSLSVYTLFMSIWYFGNRGQWLLLFLSTYILMTAGMLMKGLPAIVFQGLSLMAGLLWFGQWRRLFSWQHLTGILTAAGIGGAYLWLYAQHRPLEILLPNLLKESAEHSAVANPVWKTVEHFLLFPFDSVYHFLPFSLLILAWLDRHFWQRIRENRFVFFNFLMLAVNLPVYWSSIQVYPRYLFMFVPLFTVLSYYLMEQEQGKNSWRYRAFFGLLGALTVLLSLAFMALPFVPAVNFLPGIWPLSLGFGLVLAGAALGYFADKKRHLWWVLVSLLLARIAFDLIILPARHHENELTVAKKLVYRLAEKYRDRSWYVYGESYVRPTASFYMTQQLGYIVPRSTQKDTPNALFLVDPLEYPNPDSIFQSRPVDTLQSDYQNYKLLLYPRD